MAGTVDYQLGSMYHNSILVQNATCNYDNRATTCYPFSDGHAFIAGGANYTLKLVGLRIKHASFNSTHSTVEVCRISQEVEASCDNGLDDDCDGAVDSGSGCVSSPPPNPPSPPPPPSPPLCNGDGVCALDEPVDSCSADCAYTAVDGDGVCATAYGETCKTAPTDCPGKNGKGSFCCGDGTTGCTDPRCSTSTSVCKDVTVTCDDATCEDRMENTNRFWCVADCPLPSPPRPTPPAAPPAPGSAYPATSLANAGQPVPTSQPAGKHLHRERAAMRPQHSVLLRHVPCQTAGVPEQKVREAGGFATWPAAGQRPNPLAVPLLLLHRAPSSKQSRGGARTCSLALHRPTHSPSTGCGPPGMRP